MNCQELLVAPKQFSSPINMLTLVGTCGWVKSQISVGILGKSEGHGRSKIGDHEWEGGGKREESAY